MNILNKIPFKTAYWTLFVLFAAMLIFHLLVLLSFIPFNIVWGGRLQTHQQMVSFETVSIVVILCLLLVIQIKVKSSRTGLKNAAKVLLWGFSLLFLLNTIGNLLAKTTLETLVFTPLTMISSALCLRIAVEK